MKSFFWQMFMLAQTAKEKEITYIGLLFFALCIFMMIIDSLGKGKLVPKKGPIRKILIVIFIIVIGVVFFLSKIYK